MNGGSNRSFIAWLAQPEYNLDLAQDAYPQNSLLHVHENLCEKDFSQTLHWFYPLLLIGFYTRGDLVFFSLFHSNSLIYSLSVTFEHQVSIYLSTIHWEQPGVSELGIRAEDKGTQLLIYFSST